MFTFLVDPPPCVPAVEDKLLRTPYQTINYQCILRSLSHRQGHVAKLLDFLKQLNLFLSFLITCRHIQQRKFYKIYLTNWKSKCRSTNVGTYLYKSRFSLIFCYFFQQHSWKKLHAASHITDINTNVCSIIKLLSGNWLICHVDHVNIRKSFMYVIEVDFTDVIAPSKECLKKSVKRSCMSL